MQKEIWKPVVGYEGRYSVSNLGNVMTIPKKIKLFNGGVSHKKPRLLRLSDTKEGYKRVTLYSGDTRKSYLVHRLVAKAFIVDAENMEAINHINEIKTDNRVENLEYCTRAENNNYGTRNKRIGLSCTNGKLSKRVIQMDINGNYIGSWASQSEIERSLGFSQGSISSACLGNYKQAYGFKWKFE